MPRSGLHTRQRGQSLVETALFITLLMVLMMGVMDLGRAYFTFLSLKDAAAEGAAYASIRPDDLAGVEARARGESPFGLIDWSTTLVTTTFTGAPCRGGGVRVQVTMDYTLLTPFVGAIVGSQVLPLSADVVNTILSPGC
jgi:Flp pilus assembly protein TadG